MTSTARSLGSSRRSLHDQRRPGRLEPASRSNLAAEPYKNTRNVTAGTIRLLDPAIAAERNLRFFCHGVGETDGLEAHNHIEFLATKSATLGIPPTPEVQLLKEATAAMKAVAAIEEEMPDLPFEVDGIVFKVNDFGQRERLGIRSKSPRWLIAYKFEKYEAITRLESITRSSRQRPGRSRRSPIWYRSKSRTRPCHERRCTTPTRSSVSTSAKATSWWSKKQARSFPKSCVSKSTNGKRSSRVGRFRRIVPSANPVGA